MSNLLKMASAMMSDGMVGKIASLVGSNSGITKTALTALLPNLLKGIASKGATESGAGSLLKMIKDHALGGDMTSSFGGGDASNALMENGGKMNEAIFGSSLKDITVPGLGGDAKSKLMNLATPMVLGNLGKVVKSENLDAKGLSSYLQKQVSGDALSKVTGAATATASKATATASRAASTATTAATNTASSGLGFLKWAFPLLALLAGAWWFMNRSSTPVTTPEPVQKATKAAPAATHTHADGTVHQGATHGGTTTTTTAGTTAGTTITDKAMTAVKSGAGTVGTTANGIINSVKGLSLDKNGNLLKDGKLYLNKGEFSLKDGEYFDKEGKSLGFLGKVGKAIGDAGKAVGDAGKAVGGAVGGAATQTADFFKNSFGGMFKKKKEGAAVSAYSLNKIAFDADSHKIKSFSKQEVEGLAAALKAYPDSKITVQATGGSDKISKMKAQVIHDMLVTLGVSDKQISAKGMGDGAENFAIVID